MSSENNPAVEQILLQLQEISTQLNNESNLSDTFGNFKEEYYVRNSEVREDLRDLKVDLNNQKSDLNEIQKDVQEMKEGFSKFKIEIQPKIKPALPMHLTTMAQDSTATDTHILHPADCQCPREAGQRRTGASPRGAVSTRRRDRHAVFDEVQHNYNEDLEN